MSRVLRRAMGWVVAVAVIVSCSQHDDDAANVLNCPDANDLFCAGKCVPVSSPEHCGACDAVCRPDQTCELTSYKQWGCVCPQGQQVCKTLGVETCAALNTPEHCGDCNHACAANETCAPDESAAADAAGAYPVKCSCSSPFTKCDVYCVDTDIDEKNCGGCGHACAPSEICAAGFCIEGNDAGADAGTDAGQDAGPAPCGEANQPCCNPPVVHDGCNDSSAGTDSHLICKNGTCTKCGYGSEVCCHNVTVNFQRWCYQAGEACGQDGNCTVCGQHGTPCCYNGGGGSCNSLSDACLGFNPGSGPGEYGTCVTCGGSGQPCCNGGTPCSGNLHCNSANTCN